MARADDIGALIVKSFPGTRVTSTVRTRAEQDDLIARGATKARNSQHLTGNGLDVVLPKNVSPSQVRSFLSDRGINPGEFLNERGGRGQGTGAHLHIGLAPRASRPASTGGGDQASAGSYNSLPKIPAYQRRASQNTGPDPSQYPDIRAVANSPLRKVDPIPAAVIASYNSHKMSDEDRAGVDQLVKDGVWAVPKGQRLQKPEARTMLERAQLLGRAASEGIAGLADMSLGVLNPGFIIGGANPAQKLVDAAGNLIGAPKPESDTEKLANSVVSGATQGLITGPLMGGEALLAKAGATALDTISGGAAGYTQESARQAGAGPVAQVAAGLLGGAVPIGLAAAGERAVARIRAPKSLPEVVESVPRAAVVDEAGKLTPEGQEIAARHNVTPEEVVAAYEAPPKVQEATANDQMPEATARAAGEPPVAEPAAQAPEATVTRAEPSELPPQPNAPSVDQPNPTGLEALPATALARVQQAEGFGFGLSKGQATKDFGTQVAEQNLRKMDTPQGEEVRQWTARNAEDIKTATQKFTAAFDDPTLSDEVRGQQLQDAIHALHDGGKDGVGALYKAARDLEGADTPLPHDRVLEAADKLILETPMEQGSKDALERAMAKYGLLGDKVEDYGRYSSVVTDDGRKIRVLGKVEPLSLNNAEDFRQAMNAAYDKGTGLMGRAIKALDDTVDEAIEALPHGSARTEKFKEARAAHREVKKIFESKDIVADIAGWKNGAENITGKLSPEQIITRAFSKTSDLRRIKAVLLTKPTVASKAAWRGIQAHGLATVFKKSLADVNIGGETIEAISGAKLNKAVKDFGADKLKVLLDTEDFNSFMKLRRSIGDATIPISGTVPVGSAPWWQRLVGSVDNKVTAAFAALGTVAGGPVGTAIGGGIGKAVGGAVEASSKAKAATATMEGVTKYTPEVAATDTGAPKPSVASKAGGAVKQAGASTVRAFIDTYGSPRILAPVLASTTGAAEQ